MNATINETAVAMTRPSLYFQEESQPEGGYKVNHDSVRWVPIECVPLVDIAPGFVAETDHERWSFRGARWENGKIAYDGVTRESR